MRERVAAGRHRRERFLPRRLRTRSLRRQGVVYAHLGSVAILSEQCQPVTQIGRLAFVDPSSAQINGTGWLNREFGCLPMLSE